MRIKITKSNDRYRQGDIVEVTPNVAFGLIDSGFAIVSKDITQSDLKVKEQDGKTSYPKRTNKYTRR